MQNSFPMCGGSNSTARSPATIFCGLLILAGGFQASSADAADAVRGSFRFEKTGEPHTNRFAEHTATLLHDGSVLVTGGWDGSRGRPGRLKSAAEIFDPSSGDWTAVPDMNRIRHGHTATLMESGEVLVIGGADSQVFSPKTRTWSTTARLLQPRGRHTATRLDNGRVALVGGFIEAGKVTGKIELYDPTTGSWSDGGILSEPRAYHTALALSGNRLLLAGGENPRNTSTAVIYDATTQRVTEIAPLSKPHAYCQASTVLADGRLIITGGEGDDVNWPLRRGEPPEHLALAEIYNPQTNLWTLPQPMTSIRCGHSATLLADGRLFVVGGEGAAGTTTEIFDPRSGSWSSGPRLEQRRNSHTATRLQDGRILIVGGNRRNFTPIIAKPTVR